jgi:hypothetical protein
MVLVRPLANILARIFALDVDLGTVGDGGCASFRRTGIGAALTTDVHTRTVMTKRMK